MVGGCAPATLAPVSSPNPWPDDYTSLSSMENYRSWGTYNVHDPACRRVGEYYYMYSTDAIFRENRREAAEKGVPLGFIQMRRSKDLVNWEFLGWALPEIPAEAVEWVRSRTGGHGATNVWAPYMIPHEGKFRLYYCVSAFGRKTSYMGLAEADSPEGPWRHAGCVVKTDDASSMNAIDPSVVVDPSDGRWWMHYGSYFGGLFCVELDPGTGLPLVEEDKGHLTARRANYRNDNLEAPEIIYNPATKEYYLFVSYDPLMTTYNVRVGRSTRPEGPFTDFSGKDLRDTTNNFPVLTAPYRFEGHPGWAGTGHCGVFSTDDGRWFMAHQGRLAPRNQMMVLHLREMFFTGEGWPVVSPERHADSNSRKFSANELVGRWEIVRVREPSSERRLEAGQIMHGEGELRDGECNISQPLIFEKKGVLGDGHGSWRFSGESRSLQLTLDGELLDDLIIFAGHDWERQTETVLFTGLDSGGRSVWGKKRE
jgi:arabinan endo-1,5-alpha-L-arabinosidase